MELQPKLFTLVLGGIEYASVIKEFSIVGNASIWEGISSNETPWRKTLDVKASKEEAVVIGQEQDPLWRSINVECFTALLLECNIPFICEKMYLGEPLTQYALTHQVMYQQLGNQVCGKTASWMKVIKDEQRLDSLCRKSYLEAKFIADHGFHSYMLDLFAEHVGGCGLQGYTNFIREGWIRKIISLEEPSVGCAPNIYKNTIDIQTGESLVTSDPVMEISSTDTKISKPTECLIHLGSESLLALAVALRHLLEASQELEI